ncbi:MAG: hypothetical protein M3N16_05170, partial [Actinomycetota bacterium]|nr:hypothetical protein [Actinomycetota bacterium]
ADAVRRQLVATFAAMAPGGALGLGFSALLGALVAGGRTITDTAADAFGAVLGLVAGGAPRTAGFGAPVSGLGLPLPGPLPPPPPGARPPVEGSGPYDSESAGLDDWLTYWKLRAVKGGGEIVGQTDAARHLDHFLDNSGEPLEVEPDRLLRDMPAFEGKVRELLGRTEAQAGEQARAHYGGEPISIPFATDWQDYGYKQTEPLTENWFHALGGFSYSASGVVRVSPPATPGGEPVVRVDYQLHIFDRYNWDAGKHVELPGFDKIYDKDIQPLHRAGIAREYDIHGTTEPESFDVDPDARAKGGEPPAAPEPAGPREGKRSDPTR